MDLLFDFDVELWFFRLFFTFLITACSHRIVFFYYFVTWKPLFDACLMFHWKNSVTLPTIFTFRIWMLYFVPDWQHDGRLNPWPDPLQLPRRDHRGPEVRAPGVPGPEPVSPNLVLPHHNLMEERKKVHGGGRGRIRRCSTGSHKRSQKPSLLQGHPRPILQMVSLLIQV